MREPREAINANEEDSVTTDFQRISQIMAELADRRRFVENALGSLRIEGLEIDVQTRMIADRYIAGDISGDEMTQAILNLR